MKKIILLYLILFSQAVFSESSRSDKYIYELQDKCRKTTEDVFKKEWGSGVVSTKDGQMIASYSNHYNKKLNKCFYLLNSTNVTKRYSLQMTSLWDIQDNKSYGEFNVDSKGMFCSVGEKQCKSKDEFESLIKSYMND